MRKSNEMDLSPSKMSFSSDHLWFCDELGHSGHLLAFFHLAPSLVSRGKNERLLEEAALEDGNQSRNHSHVTSEMRFKAATTSDFLYRSNYWVGICLESGAGEFIHFYCLNGNIYLG